MANQKSTEKRSRGRSPGYPGVALGICVDRAAALYQSEHRNAAPVSAVAQLWGYRNHTTGGASVALSAMKKFGLIEDEGSRDSRVVQLTELGLDICLHPTDEERSRLIRQAALTPGIHKELWEQYRGHLPSDETLRFELIRNRSFTEKGASDFIRQFRSTVAFAQLSTDSWSQGEESQEINAEQADREPIHPESESEPDTPYLSSPVSKPPSFTTAAPVSSPALVVPIPLPGGYVVTVSGDFPVSSEAFDQLLQVLSAMRPGLVN